jgi:hypothetical protein
MSIQTGIDGLQGIGAIAGVTGVVRGIISPDIDVWDPIADAEIVAVPVSEPETPAPSVLGRRGVQQVTHAIVDEAARQNGAVSGRTDRNGRFAIATRERPAAWRVFACFDAIHSAGAEKGASLRKQVCFELGSFAASKPIGAVIPEALYCALKKLADQWTVCGRLTECTSGQAITDAVVSAFDADWLQDDALGSDHTNAAGVYRIDYPGSAFRRGTFLDIELFGGPDIYFHVADSAGHVALEEDSAQGRGPGRADRDCCARIDLCLTLGGHVPGGTTFSDTWSAVGKFVIPSAGPVTSFDAAGYMSSIVGGVVQHENYALGGAPRLVGGMERETGGRLVEYRFLVSAAATDNGGPAPADASFDRVVGEGAGAPLFVGGQIGTMKKASPLTFVPIDVVAADVRPGGWVRVRDCIARGFVDLGLDPAEADSGAWEWD